MQIQESREHFLNNCFMVKYFSLFRDIYEKRNGNSTLTEMKICWTM